MKKYTVYSLIIILLSLVLISSVQTINAKSTNEITIDYYYNINCGHCIDVINNVIGKAETHYTNNSNITFQIKEISTNPTYMEEYKEHREQYGKSYPFLIIKNETDENIISFSGEKYDEHLETVVEVIDAYLAGVKPNITHDENNIEFCFLSWCINIDTSKFSLPILTVVLGIFDSFNPCAFFILIFLLNILLYTKSRRRMLLIGGIFIFFSGLLYALFMFILYESFILTQGHVTIINIIAGTVALSLGFFNIKDFFFFKKGASVSIPDDKKPKLYKKMRNLVKHPKLFAIVIGTILLAATINFYELLCTLGFPLIFTRRLESYNLSLVESATYIFFYNLVYVIPLIIIVLIFVFTLGRRKITEWHGQIMKLASGLMLSSFGIIFLFNYQLLENVVTPIIMLTSSLAATFIISYFWKKFKDKNIDS